MLDTDVRASSASKVHMYYPCSMELKKLLTRDNIGAYTPWEHRIKEKFCTNVVIYKNNKNWVNYIL